MLRRRWLSATGLIMGSMAPDFEYFLRLKTQSEISHTLPGLFLFNLPVALLLCVLFHTLVRDQAMQYLPPYFRQRALAVAFPADWLHYQRRRWLVVSVSVVLGAFSHLFWDSFTHSGLYFVNQLPALSHTLTLPLLDQEIVLHRLVQHVSTAVGASFILWYVHQLPAKPLPKGQESDPWLGFWLLIATAGYLFLLFNLMVRRHLERKPGHMIVTLISGWLLALLLSGFVTWLQQRMAIKKG
ncbi:hypothetical protein A3841_01560 [Pontibacter flavimaris]|uniref:DUF4184 family protein n=1 Tax=Pontibacter flavimaris TaxID=1797110 RepID=A0A1Q5PAN9_9BACT|nr:hypothetical protein A3841_01560 [Pontibacter flavimaris]